MKDRGDEIDAEDLSDEEDEINEGEGGEEGEGEEDAGEAEEIEDFSGSASEAALESNDWKGKAIMVTRAVLAEFVITTIFMFIVTATAIQYNRASALFNSPEVNIHNPTVSALSSGLIAVGIIYAFADISGANFNPAVTFATVVTFKTSLLKGIFFSCVLNCWVPYSLHYL